MTAQDYNVNYKYGAYGSAGYTKSNPHRGNDRPCPCGTLLTIGSTQIGKTGRTGKATGCHLHTQAGTDIAVQNTVDPTPYEFKAGIVVGMRITDSGEWGKFVKLKVNNIYIVYAHLSEVYVKVGDKVGDDMPEIITKEKARIYLALIQGKNGLYDRKNALAGDMDNDIDKYFRGRNDDDVFWEIYNSKEARDYRERYQLAAQKALEGQVPVKVLTKGIYEVK
jgi:hypothetical protein